jgi:Exostosin family
VKTTQYSTQPTVASKQLRIYADRAYLPNRLPHIALLYAFWGQNAEDQSNPHNQRYEHYAQTGSNLFELAPIEAAQLAILPFDWSNIAAHPSAFDLAQQLAQAAAQQGISLAIFYLDDATTPVELDNTIVFRTSVDRSTRRPNDVVIPAWSEDFVEYYCQGQLPIRSKSSQPVVGYCGYGSLVKSSGIKDAVRLQLGAIPGVAALASQVGIELVKHSLPWLYGSRVRSQALCILSKSKQIQCNFRLHDVMHHTEKLTLSSRQQFVDNMFSSDYILCTRGSGNFSYRLYETLSCGRIPVFVNTDCALPFAQWIDWKRYCVWVDEVDLPHLGQRIREFHASLTPQQFQERQLECRNLWLEWLSPQAFFSNLYRYL